MRKFLLLFALLTMFTRVHFLHAQVEVDTLATIKLLQKELSFKGYTEILLSKQSTNEDPEYVFKINTINTKYHKSVIKLFKDFFSKKETRFFSASYPKYYIPEHFKYIFVPVRKYKGEYCFYRPCDFLFSFQLTDTYIAPGYMDGATAYPFVEFIKDHVNSIYVQTGVDSREWSIELVDGVNKIYRLKIDGHDDDVYYTPLDNIANLPVIGEYCNKRGAIFDKNLDKE